MVGAEQFAILMRLSGRRESSTAAIHTAAFKAVASNGDQVCPLRDSPWPPAIRTAWEMAAATG